MQRDLDAVPTMLTLNGESFAHAFEQSYFALSAGGTPAVQPFFESALGGAGSAFCKGFSSCTAAVAGNATLNSYIKQTQVFQLWSALSNTPSWTQGRTIPSSIGAGFPNGQAASISADDSSGYSNYNALYTTFTARDYKGVTTTSNFTWGRALGTGVESQATSGYTALNPYNVRQSMYGPQAFDYKFIYSQTFLYSEPFFKRGWLSYPLGGWRLGAVFTARSGSPLAVGSVNNGDGVSDQFGATQNSGAFDAISNGAVLASKYTGSSSANYNVNVANNPLGIGVNGNVANGGNNINQFANPVAVYNEFRPCVLGYDTSCGSNGQIRGLPNWNMDANIAKDFRLFRERVFMTMSFQFVNVFNHVALADPNLSLDSPADFGVLGSNENGQLNTPRNLTFNLRAKF